MKVKIGASICFDLRFPELYRFYCQKQCQILVIPAAFSVITGRAHFENLLRARAIENQAFVISATQGGVHQVGETKYETFGHSMVFDPWGDMVFCMPQNQKNKAGIGIFDLDLKKVERVRQMMKITPQMKL